MNENNAAFEQDQENVIILPGNLENFLENEKKLANNNEISEEIYDLGSFPQTSNNKLIVDEENPNEINQTNPMKNTEKIDESQQILKETKEKAAIKAKIPEINPQISKNIEKTGNSALKMEAKPIKRSESTNTSPLNKKTSQTQTIIKKTSKSAKNLEKSQNRDDSNNSIEEKTPLTSEKNEFFTYENEKFENETKENREKHEKNDESPKETQQKEEKFVGNIEKNEEIKKKVIKKEKKEKTKKKKKSKKPKETREYQSEPPPPLISVGIPLSPNENFELPSSYNNSESPDLLLKKKEKISNETPQNEIISEKTSDKNEDFKEPDFAISLNIFAFLQDSTYFNKIPLKLFKIFVNKKGSIPPKTKLFMLFVVIMMFFDILLCILEITYISKTQCEDNKDHAFVYINFIFSLIGKLIVFNFINLEISYTLPFDYEIPYIMPIVLFGMFPALQIPQFIYDYVQCKQRSPLFDLDSAFALMKFEGICLLIACGGACFLIIFFNEALYYKNRFVGCCKAIAFLFMKLFVLTLNLITLLITFSQIHSFLPAMFIENICFWFLFLIALYQKCWGERRNDERSERIELNEKSEKNDKNEKNEKKNEKNNKNDEKSEKSDKNDEKSEKNDKNDKKNEKNDKNDEKNEKNNKNDESEKNEKIYKNEKNDKNIIRKKREHPSKKQEKTENPKKPQKKDVLETKRLTEEEEEL